MTKRKTTRGRFEAHWRRRMRRVMPEVRSEVWLERDDIWGAGSYAQPLVHFAWLAFKAGYRARSER